MVTSRQNRNLAHTTELATILLKQIDVSSTICERTVRLCNGSLQVLCDDVVHGHVWRVPAGAIDTTVEEPLSAVRASLGSKVHCTADWSDIHTLVDELKRLTSSAAGTATAGCDCGELVDSGGGACSFRGSSLSARGRLRGGCVLSRSRCSL